MKSMIIESPCYIKVLNNTLIKIETKDGEMRTFDTNALDCLVLESDRSTISIKAINLLSTNRVTIIVCGSNHLPTSFVTNISGSYPRKHNIYLQLDLKDDFKNKIWKKIIQGKISNQIRIMEFLKCKETSIERCRFFHGLVEDGDITNKEATTSRIFFRQLYGVWFIRESDTMINSALNYGYAILASTIATFVMAHGLVPMLGIHHCNKINRWNLVYDLIEVVRPIVDYWVVTHKDDLGRLKLTTENKIDLIDLLKQEVYFDNQNRKLRSAIKDYINSFVRVITEENTDKLLIPKFIDLAW